MELRDEIGIIDSLGGKNSGRPIEKVWLLETPVESDIESNTTAEVQRFWEEFLQVLKLDDPTQPIPNPARLGYLCFMLPAGGGSSWLTVYRILKRGEVGVTLSSHRGTAGDYARQVIVNQWDAVKGQLGGTSKVIEEEGRSLIRDSHVFGGLDQAEVRQKAFTWLAERVNTFVNVIRPRVGSAAADYQLSAQAGTTLQAQ